MEEKKVILRYALAPVLVIFLLWALVAPSQNIGYAPEQPIEYSHELHAGEYGLDCLYCHTGVLEGKKAGVPSLNVCMNCHLSIGFGNKKIEKLQKYWEEKKSPEWVRVHNMPDHVRFSHAPHIKIFFKAGQPTKMACIPCHGDVANMKVVSQVESLNMGFCIECHEDNASLGAQTNCSACHY